MGPAYGADVCVTKRPAAHKAGRGFYAPTPPWATSTATTSDPRLIAGLRAKSGIRSTVEELDDASAGAALRLDVPADDALLRRTGD